MKLIVLLMCCLPFMTYAASTWDNSNNPGLFYEKLERTYDRLPKKGKLSTTPWSGDYWPTYKGGLTYRWSYPTRDDNQKYGYELIENYTELTQKQLSYLSPAEKYDLYIGRTDFPVTNYERNRTQILKTVPGSSVYNSEYKIPTWEGLCHSWAPATYQYTEPEPVYMTNEDGVKIPFYTSDIKALLTLKGHVLPATNQRFLGSRCYLDFKELEKKLNNGEITREEFMAQINSKSCEDVNAGAFHLILTNRIGMKDKSFIIDITRDAEVWNQPIEAYAVKELSRRSGASSDAAPGTVSEVTVQVWVRYVAEVGQHYRRTVSTKESLKVAVYKYTLELNRDNEIIGGNWLSFERPDFIWDEDVPQFRGFFAPLSKIYEKSTAYARPSSWNDKKERILKLGRKNLLAKKFITSAKNEVTKSKMLSAAKKEIIKRKFVIEAAKMALETKIRKAKRMKFLKRKVRHNVMADVWAKIFLKEVKKDAHSTKVKKKWHKLGRKASVLSTSARVIERLPQENRKLTELYVEAAKRSELEMMRRLVKEGADPTGKKIGLTPDKILSMVFSNLKGEIIKEFLELGANPTPYLHEAAKAGNLNVFKVLMSYSPELNVTNANAETVLIYLAKMGKIKLLKEVISSKQFSTEDLNAIDSKGRNALIFAIIGDNKRPSDIRVDIVKLLIDKGINYNQRDHYGETARSYVSFGKKYSHYKIRQILKKVGAKK
ncbi:MAG: ankyrin repeat domain-containing protein [Bacteriovoracaceae bacterium]